MTRNSPRPQGRKHKVNQTIELPDDFDPARPLRDARREAACQALVSGLSQVDAHERAGFARSDANATRLFQRPDVAERAKYLAKEAAERAAVSVERTLREYAAVGYANMANYMKVGDDGDPYLDFSEVSPEQAAALAEVVVEDFKDGRGDDARDVRRVKFKLHNKIAALDSIAKHLGMFDERREVKTPGGETLHVEIVRFGRTNGEAKV